MDKPHCGEKTSVRPHAVGVGLCDSAPLLWRMEDLRSVRARGLVGTLLGSLPRTPRQNLRLGRPLLLLPEEERLLSEHHAAAVLPPFNQVSLTVTEGPTSEFTRGLMYKACVRNVPFSTLTFRFVKSEWPWNCHIRDWHTNIFCAFELLASFSGDAEGRIMSKRPFAKVICTLEISIWVGINVWCRKYFPFNNGSFGGIRRYFQWTWLRGHFWLRSTSGSLLV